MYRHETQSAQRVRVAGKLLSRSLMERAGLNNKEANERGNDMKDTLECTVRIEKAGNLPMYTVLEQILANIAPLAIEKPLINAGAICFDSRPDLMDQLPGILGEIFRDFPDLKLSFAVKDHLGPWTSFAYISSNKFEMDEEKTKKLRREATRERLSSVKVVHTFDEIQEAISKALNASPSNEMRPFDGLKDSLICNCIDCTVCVENLDEINDGTIMERLLAECTNIPCYEDACVNGNTVSFVTVAKIAAMIGERIGYFAKRNPSARISYRMNDFEGGTINRYYDITKDGGFILDEEKSREMRDDVLNFWENAFSDQDCAKP